MPAICGLALALAAVAAVQGSAPDCDVTKNEGFHQCYGALGRPVFIQLMNDAKGQNIELKHNDKRLFAFRRGNYKNDSCCFDFSDNGTFRLDKAERHFAGKYSLDIYEHPTGKISQTKEFQLTLEEPVSTPALYTLCRTDGELKVSCFAGGDNPHYEWTLGGQPLGQNVLHMNYGDGVVVLGKGVSGDLACTAWNNVSRESSTWSLPTCSELGPPVNCTFPNGTLIGVRMNASEGLSLLENKKIFFTLDGRQMLSALCHSETKPPSDQKDTAKQKVESPKVEVILAVSAALAVIAVLLVVTVVAYFLCKRKKDLTPEGDKSKKEDLVYADVRVGRNRGSGRNRLGKGAEPEVVYGEVKV